MILTGAESGGHHGGEEVGHGLGTGQGPLGGGGAGGGPGWHLAAVRVGAGEGEGALAAAAAPGPHGRHGGQGREGSLLRQGGYCRGLSLWGLRVTCLHTWDEDLCYTCRQVTGVSSGERCVVTCYRCVVTLDVCRYVL